MEDLFGISMFLNSGKRIGGNLKTQPSDFVVKEIDLENNVVEWTDKIYIKPQPKIEPRFELTEESIKELTSILGQSSTESIQDLLTRLKSGDREAILELPCPEIKQDRVKIHSSIKTWAPMLTTSTEVSKNIIKVYSSQLAQSFNKRQKLGLDARGAKKRESPYIKFILHKENFDTMKALKILSRASGIQEKSFGISGIKDKCAVTTQQVTVFSNYLEKLQAAKPPVGIRIGGYQYTNSALKIGDLHGNLFEIRIRNTNIEDSSDFGRLVDSLRQNGFINYFGLQRFGNSQENPTHRVGLAILKKDYEEAVKLILAPRPVRNEDESRARLHWEEFRDVERSLSEFPKFCVRSKQHIERNVLAGMAKAGGNSAYFNGIMALPRNSRLLYGHAYQSFIWNKSVNKRLQMSLKPMPGDVLVDSQDHAAFLDENNCTRYELSDIVMPLIGSKVLIPKMLEEFLRDELASDGISLQSFQDCGKEFALTGTYRKIVVRPELLEVQRFRYGEDSRERDDGTLDGVLVKVALPSSCYATVCLRELIGGDLVVEDEKADEVNVDEEVLGEGEGEGEAS